MKLLIDMNLSPKWVEFLADAGFKTAHWSTLGLPHAKDTELMDFAKANDYTILTHDLDFGAILAATGGTGPSVVQIRADDLSTDAIGGQIISALRQMLDVLAQGALVTIDPVKTRVTVLPIGFKK